MPYAVNAGNGTTTGSTFNTSPAASGTFIPTLWSSKLNVKFYATSVFADICNRNWEGEIGNIGDKITINNIPSLTIADYVVGGNLTYQAPTPNIIELLVDKGKSFAFAVSDVLEYQSKPDLMSMFTQDAAEQMRMAVDATCIYNTIQNATAKNQGANAGIKSNQLQFGTDAVPISLTATVNTSLDLILQMAAALDEYNVPDGDRFLVIDPLTRMRLMNSDLKQVQITGDATSPIRNGKIGKIDRFDVYLSNQLPTGPAGVATTGNWVSAGAPTPETSWTVTGTGVVRRAIFAGHRSAISFASQMTKTEQLRNPNDFGDLVRGLNIYGYKVTKPEALVLAKVAN
jgi:hypothetical protein